MIYIQYDSEDYKSQIIQEQQNNGYYLVGYEYRLEGNFLVFDLQPYVTEIKTIPLNKRVSDLEATVNEILLGGI